MTASLAPHTAIVTGAGRGLGRAIALALAQAGADVVVSDLDEATARATGRDIEALGCRALVHRTDVGEPADVAELVSAAEAAFGRIDILVNNAGVTKTQDLFDISASDWDRIHRVNARGVFLCLQTVARHMIDAQRAGRIINIASIAGKGYRDTANAAYAASKGAVITLTQIAAYRLARHDINVNAICPGLTDTEMLREIATDRAALLNTTAEELARQAARSIPLGRTNTPEDIAALAVFLASEAARNITGQSINVDGGLMVH